mgnify:CR=1 FL=1
MPDSVWTSQSQGRPDTRQDTATTTLPALLLLLMMKLMMMKLMSLMRVDHLLGEQTERPTDHCKQLPLALTRYSQWCDPLRMSASGLPISPRRARGETLLECAQPVMPHMQRRTHSHARNEQFSTFASFLNHRNSAEHQPDRPASLSSHQQLPMWL